MQVVKLEHFKRAIDDIVAHGDNDTLPFDIDNRFISNNKEELADLTFKFFQNLEHSGSKEAKKKLNALHIFFERLLTPSGPNGFRITTKIHPFWNIYLNGLAVAIAEGNEKNRSINAHSYRFSSKGPNLFVREKSWRAYKEATLADPALQNQNAIVIQTDISNFYEHIYHHRIENCISDLFEQNSTIPCQIDRILSQIASGRSFGLPVGGQCSRVLAELLMTSVDQLLTQSGIVWHRYVDDFTLIASSQAEAYRAISCLSNILADYGLSLNRTKTILLKAQHYHNFIISQLSSSDQNADKLKEIDLYYDPYSDNPIANYEALQETVIKLNVQELLNQEIHKSQPDSFLISQITRTLKLQNSSTAIQLCHTLLNPENLYAFRSSWSTIIRGVASLRNDDKFKVIFSELDGLIDSVIAHSEYLLLPEASCLHFIRLLKFKRTNLRSQFINRVFAESRSITIKKACIDCIRYWKDRPSFIQYRNQWNTLHYEVQRILWLTSYVFNDEGKHFRAQVKPSVNQAWRIGIEDSSGSTNFNSLFLIWAEKDAIPKITD